MSASLTKKNVCLTGVGNRIMQRVEVRLKPHLSDARGKGLIKDIADLGISSITAAQIHDVYYIQGNVSFDDMVTICQNALTD